MQREPNTEYILSLSYGKDSLATLEAIRLLGYPLDRIITAEVWATDTIQADLPPMVEFKAQADRIIKERYGITVEHTCAMRESERLSFEKQFYTKYTKGQAVGAIHGFPMRKGQWCTSRLKTDVLGKVRKSNIRKNILQNKNKGKIQRADIRLSGTGKNGESSMVYRRTENRFTDFSASSLAQGADKNIVRYLGIAADEPERIKRHTRPGIMLPLVDIGWDEAYCRQWCEENGLLSPIYTDSARGGCWFCHNQGINQLRLLRQRYQELWTLLLKWDKDSPITFHADGRTAHDFEKRFQMEDLRLIPCDRKFRWKMLQERQGEWLDKILEVM